MIVQYVEFFLSFSSFPFCFLETGVFPLGGSTSSSFVPSVFLLFVFSSHGHSSGVAVSGHFLSYPFVVVESLIPDSECPPPPPPEDEKGCSSHGYHLRD